MIQRMVMMIAATMFIHCLLCSKHWTNIPPGIPTATLQMAVFLATGLYYLQILPTIAINSTHLSPPA